MAKNNIGFTSMEELGQDDKARELIKSADMKKSKSNAGRKKKPDNEKTDKVLAVYFTEDEKAKVQDHCDTIKMSFSSLVRSLLAREGVL